MRSDMTARDRTRVLGLASISVGVAFLAIYAAASNHPVYRLIVGLIALALGAFNLSLSRR